MNSREMREALAAMLKLWTEGGQELCERSLDQPLTEAATGREFIAELAAATKAELDPFNAKGGAS